MKRYIKLNPLKKLVKYPTRVMWRRRVLSDLQRERVESLQKDGYVILPNFISPDVLARMQSAYRHALERECAFRLPCLSQTKIDEVRHAELIKNYFLGTAEEMERHGVTFNRSDFDCYESAVSNFKPSSLTTFLTSLPDFFGVWLHEDLTEIVEAYMGMRPVMVEAYLRRNFPAKYRVMNHFWHRDRNNPDYIVKAFFFLSDCTLDTGPHEYISGSLLDQRLSGRPYYSDEEVNALYPLNSPCRIKSVVKAGTVIIEDTRGLHRATIPVSGVRDMGYAVFLPHSIFSSKVGTDYRLSAQDYKNLSRKQKSYIPRYCVD